MRPFFLPLIGLLVWACGGPAAPATEPSASAEKPAAAADASPAATGSEAAPATESKPAPEPAKAGAIEGQRESFVGSCLPQAGSKDYCDCAFEQYKVIFKDVDWSKPGTVDQRLLAELKTKTAAACGSKLSEENVKTNFANGCTQGDQRKNGYCSCAWLALRKKLAYTDFVGMDASDPRFQEQRKVMVAECKGKYPADVAKLEFMQGCAQVGSQSACTCKWTKLKKQFTVEEIVAGTVDVRAVPELADCK